MIVTIDSQGCLALEQADTFTAFHVAALDCDLPEVLATLASDARPAREGHLWLAISRLHHLGDLHGGPDWREGCDAMLEYAASKGWVNEERSFVLAHVEVESAPER